MQVQGGYEGLQYKYELEDFNDPDAAEEWVDIDPAAFILHAANMHLFRQSELALGLPSRRLWSVRAKFVTLTPDLK